MGNINGEHLGAIGQDQRLSTPYGKHKPAGWERAENAIRGFLLPMGNINSRHAYQGVPVAALSTPYGKHKQRVDDEPEQAVRSFYSLWET